MKSIDPSVQSDRDNYKLLIGSIIPRPIAFVTSMSNEGIINGAPFSYFNVVSSNPPLVSLSISRSNGRQKDTARNILTEKEFVIHIVDEHNVEKVNQTAASLPPDESEVELVDFTPAPSLKISVPGIKEAKIRMECILERSLELGGEVPSCDFIIGKVVQIHIDESIYQDGKVDPRGLAAVGRLAGHDYAKIGEIFTIERPK
ncbi:flavin reductase family protein [Neobacillus dielmonensis]|uniref:flavin reductase family protein n=1 Tax=Neobacillus dielmonensis TaxID=1347369 RepID=UPI0005A75E24|nr:flavin reductase family protein [Neobacillus dielmonensis]